MGAAPQPPRAKGGLSRSISVLHSTGLFNKLDLVSCRCAGCCDTPLDAQGTGGQATSPGRTLAVPP